MTKIRIKLLAIIILAAAAGFVVAGVLPKIGIDASFPFRLGLDLRGGTHLVYEGDLQNIPEDQRGEAMRAARAVIERRVNAFGVAEPVIQLAGDNRIIVELAGIKDIEAAKRQIGETPFLEFREINREYQDPEDPAQIDVNQKFIPTGLSGRHLSRSEIVFDPNTNSPQISLEFNSEGNRLFAEITGRNVGQPVAIFLDGTPISAPIVRQEITSGQAVISGQFTLEEARDLAGRLNEGALPVPIKLLQQQNVGPTLGEESMKKSMLAGFIGLVAVALFMMVYYRFWGVIAVLSLIVYILIAAAIFKLVPVTLTLAGIAGFILSVGMAVDANILIFERAKEEMRGGSPTPRAIARGFARAWLAIRDSNVSSLITVAILGYFGTNLIRGFAVTLGIGILVSMFTAISVTRTVLQAIYGVPNAEDN